MILQYIDLSSVCGRRTRKIKSNTGATMIVAVIIMSILLILTFSLTLVAYTLYASQNKNIASVKCAEAANTLDQALSDEITYNGTVITYVGGEPQEQKYVPEDESYLYKYLRYNLCQESTWPYYNPEEAGHSQEDAFRYFDLKYNEKKPTYDDENNPIEDGHGDPVTVDGIEGMPGRTVVCMYWKLPIGMETSSDNLSNPIENRNGVRLFVEITSEAASQSYTVSSEYVLTVSKYDSDPNNLLNSYRKAELVSDANKDDLSINPQKIPVDKLNSNEDWRWVEIVGE